MKKKEIIIDANNRSVGRVASEVAMILMGKDNALYKPNVAPSVSVSVINASKAKIPMKKFRTKEYFRHSQYPGGGKTETMEMVASKFGYKEIFRRAVYGMLPKNKLRAIMIKNLSVNE